MKVIAKFPEGDAELNCSEIYLGSMKLPGGA